MCVIFTFDRACGGLALPCNGKKRFMCNRITDYEKTELWAAVGLWSDTNTLDSRGLGLNASGPLLFAAPSVGWGTIREGEIF